MVEPVPDSVLERIVRERDQLLEVCKQLIRALDLEVDDPELATASLMGFAKRLVKEIGRR